MKKYSLLALALALTLVACNGGGHGNVEGNIKLKLPQLAEGEELAYLNIEARPQFTEEEDKAAEIDPAKFEEEFEKNVKTAICKSVEECRQYKAADGSYVVSIEEADKERSYILWLNALTMANGGKEGGGLYAFSAESSEDLCRVGATCELTAGRAESLTVNAKFVFSDAASEESAAAPSSLKSKKAGRPGTMHVYITPDGLPDDEYIEYKFSLNGSSSYSWQGSLPKYRNMRLSLTAGDKPLPIMRLSEEATCYDLLIYQDGAESWLDFAAEAKRLVITDFNPACKASASELEHFTRCGDMGCVIESCGTVSRLSNISLPQWYFMELPNAEENIFTIPADNGDGSTEILLDLFSDDEGLKTLKNYRGLPKWQVSGVLTNKTTKIGCHYNISILPEGDDYSLLPAEENPAADAISLASLNSS